MMVSIPRINYEYYKTGNPQIRPAEESFVNAYGPRKISPAEESFVNAYGPRNYIKAPTGTPSVDKIAINKLISRYMGTESVGPVTPVRDAKVESRGLSQPPVTYNHRIDTQDIKDCRAIAACNAYNNTLNYTSSNNDSVISSDYYTDNKLLA